MEGFTFHLAFVLFRLLPSTPTMTCYCSDTLETTEVSKGFPKDVVVGSIELQLIAIDELLDEASK